MARGLAVIFYSIYSIILSMAGNRMETRGKFIVLEGGDGAGKTTQAKLLAEALVKEGPVSAFKFPRKETPFGALVYEYLEGHHGDFLGLSPYLASLPYAIDQATAREELERALAAGHVVCDRYVESNLAFQAAKCSGSLRKGVIDFIERTTYEDLGALCPDLTICLEVPAEISAVLLGRRKDQYEDDMRYQKQVRGIYRTLARERKKWRVIDCMKHGALRTREDIHAEIFALVKEST